MNLREAIKNQGYGAHRRTAKILGYSEQHLDGVIRGNRAPSKFMLKCLKSLFPEGVSFEALKKPTRNRQQGAET